MSTGYIVVTEWHTQGTSIDRTSAVPISQAVTNPAPGEPGAMTPFIVYSGTGEAPRYKIVRRSKDVHHTEYTGTVAILERAYAHPMRADSGDKGVVLRRLPLECFELNINRTVQEVVCKQVVERGDHGTVSNTV